MIVNTCFASRCKRGKNMSDDVDRLLRDYLAVMEQKDKHEFHLAERAAQLEGLLHACRSKLLQQDELLTARQEERHGLVAELNERKEHISAMDDELKALRTFSRSVRKLLVMDDNNKFSLGEVLHVLCARLEDYGVVARAYQIQRDQAHDMRNAWEQSITTLESLHRHTMEDAFEASHMSAAEMLNNALQMVGVAHQDRDLARAETEEAIARSVSDAKQAKDAITSEVALLRTHVDQLVGEQTALRRERDGAMSQLQCQSDVCRVLESQRSLLITSLYKRTAAALVGSGSSSARGVSEESSGFMGMRAELLTASQNVLNTIGAANSNLTADVQALRVVNEDLRHQISAAARAHQLDHKRVAQERKAADDVLVARAESAFLQIAELRQQLSDAIGRERLCQTKLRESQEHRSSIEQECRGLRDINDDAAATTKKLEHDLKHKAREVQRLNTLLSELQDSCAQLREIIVNSDTLAARQEHHATELSDEVRTWQRTAAEQRQHVAELQSMIAERTTYARQLADEVADLRTKLKAELSLEAAREGTLRNDCQRATDEMRELRSDLATARLERDASRVEHGILTSQLRDAKEKLIDVDVQLSRLREEVAESRARESAWSHERDVLVTRSTTAEAKAANMERELHAIGRRNKTVGLTTARHSHVKADSNPRSTSGSSGSYGADSRQGVGRYGPTPSRPREDDSDESNSDTEYSDGDTSTDVLSDEDTHHEQHHRITQLAGHRHDNSRIRRHGSGKDTSVQHGARGATADDLIQLIHSSMLQRSTPQRQKQQHTTSNAKERNNEVVEGNKHGGNASMLDELTELRQKLARAEATRDFSIHETARLREEQQLQLLMAAARH